MVSKNSPKPITASSAEELAGKIMSLQAQENGKVSIVTIYYDSWNQQHVCWYYPLSYSGAGIF